MNSNDLLAAVAAYVVSDGGDQELAKAKVKRILAGVSDSPAKKPDTMDSVIKQILLELGIPNSLKGYSRVICAIRIVAEDPSVADSITKGLYPMVAKEFNDTPSRVERAIRHAIESAIDRCTDSRVIKRYFGNTISAKSGKPTNSAFITRLADVTRQKLGM